MNIVMRDNKGKPVAIEIGFKDGKVVSGYNHTTGRKYSVTGAKRIHGGHKIGYRFMSDVYGKPATVPFGVRRTYARQFKQKIPVGRPPKVRKRDKTKSAIGKRTNAILRRIEEIRNVGRKSALRIYRYLKTVCAGFPSEHEGVEDIKISRALVWGDDMVIFVFRNEQSPTFMLRDHEGRAGDDLIPNIDFQPIFWRAKDLSYREVLEETHNLNSVWDRFLNTADFEKYGVDPDNLVFIGLAAEDQP
jgi:hypothetical protein